MLGDQQQNNRGSGGFPQPAAVEVHGLDAAVSLLQLRQLFNRVSPVLQAVAALDTDSQQGVALVIFSSEQAAATAVELFDGCPLGNAYLHVKRAESLANSLINLLYSLEQQSNSGESSAPTAQQQQAAATAAFLEQQHFLQNQEQRRQQQAWDVAAGQEQRRRVAQAQVQQAQAQADEANQNQWSNLAHSRQQQLGNGAIANGHAQQNGNTASAAAAAAAASAAQQQKQQLEQLEDTLLHMQLDQQQAQQQAAAAANLQAQQQRQPAMSWASAAAAAPTLAALGSRPSTGGQPQTAAATLAANAALAASSDEWQTTNSGRGRQGRQGSAPAGSDSTNRAGSSVSSGSPHGTRSSEDKAPRPGGQDGASVEPTTKLWMGGIDGAASAETVRAVFGRFGPIYDYELQPATHEKGRTDQWGFVNYKRIQDATRAYDTLVGEVIPELTGTRKLKLQFRPVDTRRSGSGRR